MFYINLQSELGVGQEGKGRLGRSAARRGPGADRGWLVIWTL